MAEQGGDGQPRCSPAGESVAVEVQFACDRDGVPTAPALATWARGALSGAVPPLEIVIRIVDAGESAALNEAYRRKGGPTNVLSFPFDPPPQVMSPLLGDLVICAPVVIAEAQCERKPVDAHWAHMVVHGALHLLGYDHHTQREAAVMEREEVRILNDLGYPDPYRDSEVLRS